MTLLVTTDPMPRVRLLTLNRPDKRNALSWALVDELCVALRRLQHDDTVDVVVLTGAGTAFCAGADINEQFSDSESLDRQGDIGRTDLWSLLETLPQVVIAAVNGPAFTGGFLLAYSCDLIVASDEATFQDTHAALGLLPTGGEAQRLTDRVGALRARELFFTSRRLSARQALDWGLVTAVCGGEELLATTFGLAEQILTNDRSAVRSLKRMINGGLRGRMAPALLADELENEVGTANLVRSPDRAKRVDDFVHRRRR